MAVLDSPKLNRMEKIVRDSILPVLPEDWANQDNLDDDDVLAAQSILAQEYLEHANLDGVTKILLIVGFYDWAYILPSQSYGLILSAYGSMVLAAPTMHTPESLVGDTIAQSKSLEDKIRIKAREAVNTNVGMVPLLFGFLIQLFAVVKFTPSEFIRNNILVGALPAWMGAVGLWILADLYMNGPLCSVVAPLFQKS